jgi:exonuclease VII small subunit
MEAAMEAAVSELDILPLDRPLASQELGAQLYSAAVTMLQDVAGWVQLFRMKTVETG